MELIRKILITFEEDEDRKPLLSLDGYTDEQVGYHSYLIVDAGLASGGDITTIECNHTRYILSELTWSGHDFLDAAREPGRWEKAQGIFRKMGGVTFEVAKSVLTNLMTQQANQLLGSS